MLELGRRRGGGGGGRVQDLVVVGRFLNAAISDDGIDRISSALKLCRERGAGEGCQERIKEPLVLADPRPALTGAGCVCLEAEPVELLLDILNDLVRRQFFPDALYRGSQPDPCCAELKSNCSILWGALGYDLKPCLHREDLWVALQGCGLCRCQFSGPALASRVPMACSLLYECLLGQVFAVYGPEVDAHTVQIILLEDV